MIKHVSGDIQDFAQRSRKVMKELFLEHKDHRALKDYVKLEC